MKKRVTLAVVILYICNLLAPTCASAKITRSGISAPSALVVNSRTGNILFSKNAHQRRAVASTVKVMTALVVLERCPLDKKITVSRRAALTQPSKVHLKAGVKYSVRDLLLAVLLESANDASVALAEGVAGSEWEFVKLMNERAKQLGARDTFFVNTHGLPDRKRKQYSTAHDMVLILKEAMKEPAFIDMMERKRATIRGSDGRTIHLKSHNKFLWNKKGPVVYGKTGFTRTARHCFLGFYTKGKTRRAFAVLGSPKKAWPDIRKLITY